MVLYQHILLFAPRVPLAKLVNFLRNYADTVIKEGGVLRGVENNGLRPLQERAKRKFATPEGDRLFWDARYITTTFDLCPKGLSVLERTIRSDDHMIRFYTKKQETVADRFNGRNFKNPYLEKKILK